MPPPRGAAEAMDRRGEGAWRLSALEGLDMARLAGQRRRYTCRAASSNGSPSPAPWSRSPRSSWPTSRSASLDPRNTQVVMDALLHINRRFGITVICNLHSLDLRPQILRPAGRPGSRQAWCSMARQLPLTDAARARPLRPGGRSTCWARSPAPDLSFPATAARPRTGRIACHSLAPSTSKETLPCSPVD